MSEGHAHREIDVPPRLQPLVDRVLLRPVLLTSRNFDWVDRSRLVFKPGKREGDWVLSPMGVTHGLTGLVLNYPDSTKEQQ